MEEPDSDLPPEPPVAQWPPAPHSPPPPRFALEEPAFLALDTSPPPAAPVDLSPAGQAPPAPKAIPWDPQDDKAKERSRAVLRPTSEDYRRATKKGRVDAALRGMAIAVGLLVMGPSAGLPRYLLGCTLGAGCGVLAHEWRDSAGSWSLCMGLAGLALGLTYGSILAPLAMGAFMAAGWIQGLLREFR